VTDRPLDYLEVVRRALVSVGWLALAYPLIRALTALVMAWTSAASDPLGIAR
jgi:hypothetical protein